MFEAAIVVLIVLLLAATAALPSIWLLWLGVALGTLGALVGVPAGLVYHARLWQGVRENGHSAAGIWLWPMRLHEHVSERDLPMIERWFLVGALGFLATVTGGLAVLIALIRILA